MTDTLIAAFLAGIGLATLCGVFPLLVLLWACVRRAKDRVLY
jgi:thiol:disulfide interchange protein